MKKLVFPFILILLGILLITACGPDSLGVNNTSVSFSIRTVSNGNIVGGVTLSYGETSLETGSDGTLAFTINSADYPDAALPEAISITASKKFFVSSSATYTLSEYAASSIIAEDLEIAPRIFIPDMMGNAGIGRIVAVDDMNGTNRVDLSEIPGYSAVSVETSDEDESKSGKLDCPTAINVDYDNGIIYIFDIQSYGGSGSANSSAVLIRLTDYPDTASDTIAESDVRIFPLENLSLGGSRLTISYTLRAVSQAAVTGPDELLVLESGSSSALSLYRLSGMASGTLVLEQSAADSYEGIGGYKAEGISMLPDGKILMLRDTGNGNEDFLILDDFDNDNTPESWIPQSDDMILALRTLTDRGGTSMFSGSADPLNTAGADFIIRFTISSSAEDKARGEIFGSRGTGQNQFNEPVLLAVLPDNYLYIMDTGNQRLVRINWNGTVPSGWATYEPEDNSSSPDYDESFGFGYFFVNMMLS